MLHLGFVCVLTRVSSSLRRTAAMLASSGRGRRKGRRRRRRGGRFSLRERCIFLGSPSPYTPLPPPFDRTEPLCVGAPGVVAVLGSPVVAAQEGGFVFLLARMIMVAMRVVPRGMATINPCALATRPGPGAGLWRVGFNPAAKCDREQLSSEQSVSLATRRLFSHTKCGGEVRLCAMVAALLPPLRREGTAALTATISPPPLRGQPSVNSWGLSDLIELGAGCLPDGRPLSR